MLLPVITQGGDVMPVLAATRHASYVSRSSVGKTCSTCHEFKGLELNMLLRTRLSESFLCSFNLWSLAHSLAEAHTIGVKKRSLFLSFWNIFPFQAFHSRQVETRPSISKQIKTTVYSYLDKTKEGLFKYFKTVSTDQPFDPLRQLTPTP